MIKERRNVRKFKIEKVDRELMREIVSLASWAPSWSNFQVARYTLVDDAALIQRLGTVIMGVIDDAAISEIAELPE